MGAWPISVYQEPWSGGQARGRGIFISGKWVGGCPQGFQQSGHALGYEIGDVRDLVSRHPPPGSNGWARRRTVKGKVRE